MSVDNMVVGFVIAMFSVFMLSLGWVSWWSNQGPKPSKARTEPEAARGEADMKRAA